MKGFRNCIIALTLCVLSAMPAAAITFKLASPAPQASPWGRTVSQIANRWSRETNGKVKLRVFPNSIAGSDEDVVRKLRINQLQAAILTSVGLNLLTGDVLTFSAPGLIRSQEEVEYVFERIEPTLSRGLNEGRMEILGWSKPGWLYLFSKERVTDPEELKRYRIASAPELASSLQRFGYRTVSVPISEWLTSLNSGLVEGIFSSPIAAAGFQWFGIATNMLDLQLAPFLSGFVVSDRAWRRLSKEQQQLLREIVQDEINKLDVESLKLEEDAIETMQSFGLNLVPLNQAERAQWFEKFRMVNEDSLDRIYSREVYTLIRGYLEDVRE